MHGTDGAMCSPRSTGSWWATESTTCHHTGHHRHLHPIDDAYGENDDWKDTTKESVMKVLKKNQFLFINTCKGEVRSCLSALLEKERIYNTLDQKHQGQAVKGQVSIRNHLKGRFEVTFQMSDP